MAYKDTLTLYEELIAKGTPEPEAKTIAHQLGGVNDVMQEIRDEMHGIRKDMMWMRVIGGAMTLAFVGNFFK